MNFMTVSGLFVCMFALGMVLYIGYVDIAYKHDNVSVLLIMLYFGMGVAGVSIGLAEDAVNVKKMNQEILEACQSELPRNVQCMIVAIENPK